MLGKQAQKNYRLGVQFPPEAYFHMKTGKFILVTGFFGAGKSSLVNAAIKNIPNLVYLKTITTRPKRKEELEEYSFVTLEKYEILRRESKKWDHSEIAGNYYGANISEYNKIILEGKNVICCIAPEVKTIEQMSSIYAVKPLLIWIDAKLSIANKRLVNSEINERIARKNNDLQTEKNASIIKAKVDWIFTPKGNIEEDKTAFAILIKKLLK